MAQQTTENPFNLCGGDILPSPAKSVAASVPEIHVAIFIHHQHVTWQQKETETTKMIISIILDGDSLL